MKEGLFFFGFDLLCIPSITTLGTCKARVTMNVICSHQQLADDLAFPTKARACSSEAQASSESTGTTFQQPQPAAGKPKLKCSRQNCSPARRALLIYFGFDTHKPQTQRRAGRAPFGYTEGRGLLKGFAVRFTKQESSCWAGEERQIPRGWQGAGDPQEMVAPGSG